MVLAATALAPLGALAPSPADAVSPYMSSQGQYRYCTNIGLAGCKTWGAVTKGTLVTMHCWIDDSNATGAYASPRWFYVTAGSTRGFVHSSRVADQASVPHCSTHRGISVARWAAMKEGVLSPTAVEKRGEDAKYWGGWCYLFTADTYIFGAGATPITGKGSAKKTFEAYKANGKVSTDLRHNAINVGSMVFWTSGAYGHAAVYLGQGMVATTRGATNETKAIEIQPMSLFGTPAGWVAPGNI